MPRVSIAALIQPTSFKVIHLVEGNSTSRLGQAGEGERWEKKRCFLLRGSESENWVWRQGSSN